MIMVLSRWTCVLWFIAVSFCLARFNAGNVAVHHSATISSLAEGIVSSSTSGSTIAAVDLKAARITDEDAMRLVTLLGTGMIRTIAMKACTTTRKNLISIFTSSFRSSTLETLSIHNCHVCAKVLSSVAKQFDSKEDGQMMYNRHLKTLDLSFNYYETDAMRPLIAIINRCTALCTLALDSNKMSTEAVARISQCLKRHPSLQHVSLSNCGIDDESIDQISIALKGNRNITTIDLSMNEFSSEGFQVLTETFRSGTGKLIESIDLSYNKLGDSGLINLARAIETNQLPALKHLLLREVGAGSHSVERLLNSIQNGSLLETLDISGNILFPSRSKKYKLGYSPKSIKKKLMQLTGELTPQISSAVKSFSGAFTTHLNTATELLESKKTALLALTQPPPKAYNMRKGRRGKKSESEGTKQKDVKGRKGKGKDGKGKQAKVVDDDSEDDSGEVPPPPFPRKKGGSTSTPVATKGKSKGKGRASTTASKEDIGRKLVRKGGKGGKKGGPSPVPASVMFSEEKLLQRSRVRALRALLRACAMASKLRTLGLARVGLTDAASVLLTRVVDKDKEKDQDQDQGKDQDNGKDQGKEKGKGRDTNRMAKSPPIIEQKKSLVESIVDMSGTPDVIKTLSEATTATDADADVDVDTKLYKNLRKTDPVAEAEAAAAKRRKFEVNLTLNELSTASVSSVVEALLTT